MSGTEVTILIQGAFLALAFFYFILITRKNEQDARIERREYASSLISQTKLFLDENARATDVSNKRVEQLENKLLMFTDKNYGLQVQQLEAQLRSYEHQESERQYGREASTDNSDEDEMPVEAEDAIRRMVLAQRPDPTNFEVEQ